MDDKEKAVRKVQQLLNTDYTEKELDVEVRYDICSSKTDTSNFILFMEASAYLKEPAAGAGQGAAQSATPDGSQIYTGIDLAHGADFTAEIPERERLRELPEGFMNYGA